MFAGNSTMAVIYLCPADKRLLCPWEGYATDIKQHFEEEHDRLLFHTNRVQIDLNTSPDNKLLHLDGEIYLLQHDIRENAVHVKLRYLGSNQTAAKIHYELAVTVNGLVYRHDPGRLFSCVVPTQEGWQINLDSMEKFHGKIEALTCSVLIANANFVRRKSSLNINNRFVEKNACDVTEANYLDALSLIDGKLEELRQQQTPDDIMDRISYLDLDILERPFTNGEETRSEHFCEFLPNIPEELNLACSNCGIDMLPPIYMCENGHCSCSWCKTSCRICGGKITMNRNTELENISRTHTHHCRYFPGGCNEKLLYSELRAHEAKCQFCKFKCLSNSCPFQGKLSQFHNHLKVVHSSVKVGLSTRNEFPKNHELYVLNPAIGVFYCKSEADDHSITWRATFCGPSERLFFCELIFKNSKYKEPIFLTHKGPVFEITKSLTELKKMKAKEKYAVLAITSCNA